MPSYTQHDVNLEFLRSKGFDTTTAEDLDKTLE